MEGSNVVLFLALSGWLAALFTAIYAVMLRVQRAHRDQQIVGLREQVYALRDLAITDELTGVGSRHYFQSEARRMIAHALRSGESLAMLVIDVNELKALNSRFGNPGADQILKKLGEVMTAAFRPTDLVCRMGGDEFIVLLSNTNAKGAQSAVARFAGRMRATRVKVGGMETGFSVSIGGAAIGVQGGSVFLGDRELGSARDPNVLRDLVGRLYEAADQNVHKAKKLKGSEVNPTVIR